MCKSLLNSNKIDSVGTIINDLSQLANKSLVFVTTSAVTIGNTGQTIPSYSRCIFINYESNDGALIAIPSNGKIISAFRINSIWTNTCNLDVLSGFFTRDSTNTSSSNLYTRLFGTLLHVSGWFVPASAANAANKIIATTTYTTNTNSTILCLDQTTKDFIWLGWDINTKYLKTLNDISSHAGHVCAVISACCPVST